MATKIGFHQIYSFYSEDDAQVIEDMLRENHITCMVSRIEHALIADKTGTEKTLSVEEDFAENARGMIKSAIKEGIISANGAFRF